MTTDNTQELDYTHPDEMPTVEHKPSPSSDLRGIIVHFTSKMLDSPNDYGIYPTTNFYNDLEEAILDWHNKQTLELLDRLESNMRGKTVVDTADGWKEFIRKHVNGAIEAERIKLQAGGDWQGIAILTAMKLKESK